MSMVMWLLVALARSRMRRMLSRHNCSLMSRPSWVSLSEAVARTPLLAMASSKSR